ncbi:hatching enzyme 1.2-like [Takifugu flavidus]|uniref:hatching enzyme 1.2-like n=1 Tax=Takifugu flavidus TaxID=433684 RepID=UPI002544A094|nr:hatching enzyme 1.2-like [Takifugu flavidus]
MTTIMTPIVLFLLFLSLTAIPPSAAQEKLGDDDESVDISAIISEANKNITAGIEDGDVAPPRKRNASPCTSRGCKWRTSRGYVRIPYVISSSYSSRERSTIIGAMNIFNRYTCVRFFQRRWWHWFFYRDYIYFTSRNGCWSYIGRQGGRQYISLQRPGCVSSGVVHHEILHALGFHHEQSRSDRDRFVTINYANIQPGRQSNFRKVQTNNLGTSYNYRSVMHYRKTTFSRNGLPTVVAKGNPNQILGSSFITYSDIIRVRRLYGCR